MPLKKIATALPSQIERRQNMVYNRSSQFQLSCLEVVWRYLTFKANTALNRLTSLTLFVTYLAGETISECRSRDLVSLTNRWSGSVRFMTHSCICHNDFALSFTDWDGS